MKVVVTVQPPTFSFATEQEHADHVVATLRLHNVPVYLTGQGRLNVEYGRLEWRHSMTDLSTTFCWEYDDPSVVDVEARVLPDDAPRLTR